MLNFSDTFRIYAINKTLTNIYKTYKYCFLRIIGIIIGIIIIKLFNWDISRKRNQLLKVACSPSRNKYVLETMAQGTSPNNSTKKQMTPTVRQFKVGDLVIVCADDTPVTLTTGSNNRDISHSTNLQMNFFDQ